MDDCPSTPRVRSGVTCWWRSGKPTERVYGDEQLDRLTRRVLADSAGIPLLVVALLHAVAAGFEPHDAQQPWPNPTETFEQTLPGDLPDNVVAAIRINFRRLSADAQRVLAATA